MAVAGAVLAWTGSAAVVALTREDGTGAGLAGVFIASVLSSWVVVRRFRRRVRLEAHGDHLTFVSLFGSRRLASAAEGGRALTATVDMGGYRSRRWLLLDVDDRVHLGLDLSDWDAAALDELARKAGLETADDPEPRRPSELRRVYPGSVSWARAHPLGLTFLLILAVGILQQTAKALL